MIIIIDNYDSFVYNLAQYVGELGWEPVVYRNDQVTLAEIESSHPSHIVISPGPCTPLEAGISNDVVRYFAGKIPILGVCLGHQCIGYVYGAQVVRAPVPTHGKSTLVYHPFGYKTIKRRNPGNCQRRYQGGNKGYGHHGRQAAQLSQVIAARAFTDRSGA